MRYVRRAFGLLHDLELLNGSRMSYFRVGVYPSMNPSRVQLRRSPSLAHSSHIPRSTPVTLCIVCISAVLIMQTMPAVDLLSINTIQKILAAGLLAIHMVKKHLASTAASEPGMVSARIGSG